MTKEQALVRLANPRQYTMEELRAAIAKLAGLAFRGI